MTTLLEILKTQLADDLSPGADTFLAMFAEDGALECPFAPVGGMHRVVGKDNIAAYLASIKDVLGSDGMTLLAAYRVPENSTTILEYEGIARDLRNNKTYSQKYVALAQVHDGHLSLFREYWNPLPLLEAFGDDFLDAFAYPKAPPQNARRG